MSLKLLGRATSSNVQKVLWLLDELRLPYERVDIGGPFGQNDTPAYLALNPNGVVPTLIDDELVVWESNSILRYIGNRYSCGAMSSLYPMNPAARSHVERWMDWQLTTINLCNAFLFQGLIRKVPEHSGPARIEQLRLENVAAFGLLERQLQSCHYVAGHDLTLADMTLGAIVHRWFNLPIERPAYPHVRAWYDRLLERDAYRQHVAIALA